MENASYFLVIRLGPKTSECEKKVTVVSTVRGCDVTNCATTLHGFNRHSKRWSLFSLRDKFPCTSVLNTRNRNFFWRFGFVWFRSRCDPKKLFGLEMKFQSWYRYNHVLDEGRPLHPRLGRFSCSHESTLLLGMLHDLKVVCTLDVPSAKPQMLLQVQWRIVPSQFLSRNQRRIIVWSISDLQQVLRTSARILATSFPVQTRQFERKC